MLQFVRIQQPSPVMNGQNLGLLSFQSIDEAIASQDDLANSGVPEFRDHPAGSRKHRDAISGLGRADDKEAGMRPGIFGDEFHDGLHISGRLGCPLYFNHFSIFRFILAWEIVLPASASLMPLSIFARNTSRSMASS